MSIQSDRAASDVRLSESKRRLLEKYLRGDVPSDPEAQDFILRRASGVAAPPSGA